jgi:hypothetical protein
VRLPYVIHVLLQRILNLVVLPLALPVILTRLHLHLGVLVRLLLLVVALRVAGLLVRALVVSIRRAASLLVVTRNVQVLLARLLRQVLTLLLRVALVVRLRAAPHVAVGHRATVLLSWVVECSFV